jgi:hypothetical protein
MSRHELVTIANQMETVGGWHIEALKVIDAADQIEQLERHNLFLRTALAIDERRVATLEGSLSNLCFAARTSGGVAGRDEILCDAIKRAESLLQFTSVKPAVDMLAAKRCAGVLSLNGFEVDCRQLEGHEGECG